VHTRVHPPGEKPYLPPHTDDVEGTLSKKLIELPRLAFEVLK
jgi:hypothetical protein